MPREHRKYKNEQSGIYIIRNVVNGKFYIGSSVAIKQRWATHKRALRNECHDNAHLQRAWTKYGMESFLFEILDTIPIPDKCQLRLLEQTYLDRFVGLEWCYNTSKIAIVNGKHEAKVAQLPQERSRLALYRTYVKLPENMQLMQDSGIDINCVYNDELWEKRCKIVKEHRSRKMSKISRERQLGVPKLWARGKTRSTETKKRMSNAAKGKSRSNETRRRAANAANNFYQNGPIVSEMQQKEMVRLYEVDKLTNWTIATMFGVSKSTVNRILNNPKYRSK